MMSDRLRKLACLMLLAVLMPLAVSVAAQEEFKRDIRQISFVPKGQWITGVSVSYSQSDQNKYQFLIFENLSGDTYTFKVSPMLMYAFHDDLAAGGRLSYSRQRTRLSTADVVLGQDTEYSIDHLYSISHNYHATAAFRQYLSLGNTTRFGLLNEVQLELGGGQSKLVSGVGEALTGTYERSFSLNVGLSPGVIVFLNNYSALEINVGVLGFNYTDVHSTTDQIYVSRRKQSSANFKVNLFSITFGVAFYI